MSEPFRIGIAGLGTVGIGVVKILRQNAELIEIRAGRPIEIVSISARDKTKDRGINLSPYKWIDNLQDLAEDDSLDAVVELIGGAEGAAPDLVRSALAKGRHVVTANKAMMALHGFELARLAEDSKVSLMFEASVAGGIPVIKAAREGLAANRITGVYGILNGTCNYILTQMRETKRNFNEVLEEAQEKGYAEADPSFDIDGIDAGHKLSILAAILFGTKPDFESVSLTGIRQLTSSDIVFAGELGYKIKLLGIAKNMQGGVIQSVEPCLVPVHSPLGAIEDSYNAVFIEGDFVETPLFTGRGAGQGPTASAVVADIIDLVRGARLPTFGIPALQLKEPRRMDAGSTVSCYYLRLNVFDQPGVIADISSILRDLSISIESLLQRGRDPGQPVPVVMTMHETTHADMLRACALIEKLDCVVEKPCLMRIETEL